MSPSSASEHPSSDLVQRMLSHERQAQNFNMDQTPFSIELLNMHPQYRVQSHFYGSVNGRPSILAVSERDGQSILNS
jgi:hypothetical protein